MDRLINLLVKFFVFLSRFAPIFSKLGFVDYRDIGDLEKEPKMYILPRYHAQVLSMDARVPNVAISMDERLDNIMQEMDLSQYQLLHADDTELASELTSALEHILFQQEQIKDKIGRQLVSYQNTLDEMGDFLISWLLSHKSPI